MRIDKYLFEKNLAKSRSYAHVMIKEGLVFCNGKMITKPSFDMTESDLVEIKGEILRYVSRGGLKLEAALKNFQIDVTGMVCADIGASTGGFTDCLLQNGATRVYAIDVGTSQLHPSLLKDTRVISIENCNVRYLKREDLPELCHIAVCDVSFISQTLLHRPISSILSKNAYFITLIKPQFEVGRDGLGKGGIVKEELFHQKARETVIASCQQHGFTLLSLIDSPIEGGDGNREYLALFRYQTQ